MGKNKKQFPKKIEIGFLLFSKDFYQFAELPFIIFVPANVDTTKPIIKSFKTENLALGVMCGYYLPNDSWRNEFIKKYATKKKLDKLNGIDDSLIIAPVIIEYLESYISDEERENLTQVQGGDMYVNGDTVTIKWIIKRFDEFDVKPYMPQEKIDKIEKEYLEK